MATAVVPSATTNGEFRSPSKPIYITNHVIADNHLCNLPAGPIGFDLEWRPNFRKNQRENSVALVQLANADTVLLLHIKAMSSFPSSLYRILYSTDWIKIGVGIQHDCKKLYNDHRVSVRNCVDLSLFARSVDNARWKGSYTNSIGLARLLEIYGKATLKKGRTQRSNWERTPLTAEQREYAACDAHAGYTIYRRLEALKQAVQPPPEPTYYSFSCISGELFDHNGHSPWLPRNPHYDPGPPPPPKVHKDYKPRRPHDDPGTSPPPKVQKDHKESPSSPTIPTALPLGLYLVSPPTQPMCSRTIEAPPSRLCDPDDITYDMTDNVGAEDMRIDAGRGLWGNR